MQTSQDLAEEYAREVQGKTCKWCGKDFQNRKTGILTVGKEHYHPDCFTKTPIAKHWKAETKRLREQMIKDMTLEARVKVVDDYLKNEHCTYTISTKGTDDHYIRITVRFKKVDIHILGLQTIEHQAGLKMAWFHYCNDPNIRKRNPSLPKYMEQHCNGKSMTILFVRELK